LKLIYNTTINILIWRDLALDEFDIYRIF